MSKLSGNNIVKSTGVNQVKKPTKLCTEKLKKKLIHNNLKLK